MAQTRIDSLKVFVGGLHPQLDRAQLASWLHSVKQPPVASIRMVLFLSLHGFLRRQIDSAMWS